MPGIPELLLILLIVLLVFGAGKLPQIGDALGRSIKNFKRASKGQDEIEVQKKPQIAAKRANQLEDGDADEDDADEAEEAEVVAAAKKKKKEAS
jgi:sec-independent protein translocase protein TatA